MKTQLLVLITFNFIKQTLMTLVIISINMSRDRFKKNNTNQRFPGNSVLIVEVADNKL